MEKKAYFIQLINRYTNKKQILLSGAVLAENAKEATKKAIRIASNYRDVKEIDAKLYLYTIIELTDERDAEFSVEHRN